MPEHWVQERRINGVWEHFCTYDLRPPEPRERDAIYQRHHTPGESWVMDRFRLIRCREDEVYSLYNGHLVHFTAIGKDRQPVSDMECAPLQPVSSGCPGSPLKRPSLRFPSASECPPAEARAGPSSHASMCVTEPIVAIESCASAPRRTPWRAARDLPRLGESGRQC